MGDNVTAEFSGTSNPEVVLADDFVRYTRRNIFLTGKAGTGKTTFLHRLKSTLSKRMIVTAPTGVAAINAGGVTLHSFFQIPFGPYIPGSDIERQLEQRRFSKEKIGIFKRLDLLVIDEISMVRADLLDSVDAVLRRYKQRHLPFGGVQLLMIGDLHQLSPVVKDDEWRLLKNYYHSCYFFSSNALRQAQLITVELQHIYRQSDAEFIRLLNRVRENRVDAEVLQALNARYIQGFEPDKNDDYITLTTHNRSADTINTRHLEALQSKSITFPASVEGDFPEYNYPTAATLTLKVGAQVMFVRNDASAEKLYFNGKIGKIIRIDAQKIAVKCPDDSDEVLVEPSTWENINYTWNEKAGEIDAQVIGKFTQYPLRPAWAITIHKSQGLTFERAIIDANAAFSHGQVYVALSRCKTFQGMVLSTPISRSAIKTDAAVAGFVEQASRNPATPEQLNAGKIEYQQKLLLDCFDFQALVSDLTKLVRRLSEHHQQLQFSGIDAVIKMERQVIDEVIIVADKFRRQLQSLFAPETAPENDARIQERVRKASHYFTGKLQTGLVNWTCSFDFDTDNTEAAKNIHKALEALDYSLAIMVAGMESCRAGFSVGAYLGAVSAAETDFRPRNPGKRQRTERDARELRHPVLFRLLQTWRAQQAEVLKVDHYRILHQKVLLNIAAELPDTTAALLAIKGVGKHTVDKYGEQIIAIVNEYQGLGQDFS